jgi:hypothetical protein
MREKFKAKEDEENALYSQQKMPRAVPSHKK